MEVRGDVHARKAFSLCTVKNNFFFWFSAEELQNETKTDLTPQEKYFIVCEHLRQVQLLENLDTSSAPIVGAVFTYQNMYSS